MSRVSRETAEINCVIEMRLSPMQSGESRNISVHKAWKQSDTYRELLESKGIPLCHAILTWKLDTRVASLCICKNGSVSKLMREIIFKPP